ncbi:zinc finger MYND-type containing 8 isoform X2 [Rhynchophorus ferrugineus]|uniref:zinc finger MYND-type containing 8 isoform X2 n=1 Tax=Rhynchophorus ferrugineus TaxID=354439 RepID=UPI003FCC301B
MSQNADQSNGMLKESNVAHENEADVVEVPEKINSSSPVTSVENTTDIKEVTDTTPDISTSSKSDSADPTVYSFISQNNENQVEKINKITIESDESVSKLELEENANISRELKLLLALSKEANLETNLSRKRKSVGLKRKPDYRNSPSKGNKIQYPVTAESELEMELPANEDIKGENKADDGNFTIITTKSTKRKKSSFSDTSGDGAADEAAKRNRKSLTTEIIMFKPNKDMFCWRCHKDNVNICCETCPRSYHQKCLKQTISDPDHWPCPECVSILLAESTQSRSPALKGMTLEHLCSLLKFAVNRMIQCQGSQPFIHAVSDNEFPDYKKYIIQPMDLTLLEKNIKENFYGSTQAFEADAKWILHNSIVFNSYQSKLTTVARSIIKICKQEMAEIENCPTCYKNANTKKNTWFLEVCPKPHLLVWAKLRGFPYWPGKAMSCKDGMVDVRFFGAHDRAWVPEKECFLYSPKDPNSFRAKRADIAQCVEELLEHVENLKNVFGEFRYPPFKTPLDPNNEIKQIEMFLPQYKSDSFKHKTPKKASLDGYVSNEIENQISDDESKEILDKDARSSKECNDDEAMEGYGTDDEDMTDLDTELRKNLMKPTDDKHEADEDDTQVPSNIEPDKCGSYELVLTKGALKSFSERKNSEQSDCNKTNKGSSHDPNVSTPSKKTNRRDSDAKSESNRISDKINRVDISENMEISLGNDDRRGIGYSENISSSSSECSSDFSMELKRKPIQVDVDNAEFTISPASKFKMADKLIQRLSDALKDSVEDFPKQCGLVTCESESLQNIKRNISDQTENLTHPPNFVGSLKSTSEPNFDSDSSSDIGNSVSSSDKLYINLCHDTIKDGVSKEVSGYVKNKHEDMLLESADDERTMPVLSPKTKEETTHDKEENSMAGNESDGPKSCDENSTDDNTPLSTITQPKLLETSTDFPITKEISVKRKSILEQDANKTLEDLDLGTISSGLEKNALKKFKTNITPVSELVRIRLPEKPVKSYIPSKNQKHDVTLHKITNSTKTVNPKNTVEDLSDNLAEQQNNVDISKLEENDDPPKLNMNNSTKVYLHEKDSDESDNSDENNEDEEIEDPLICDSEAKIIDIIHSSLNDSGSNSPEKSIEKISYNKDEPPSSKKIKLSSESSGSTNMLKSREENECQNKSSDKENKSKTENFSLLRKTLHGKRISRRSSVQNSPGGSNRSSLHENISDDVKSEADSESESLPTEELEAKKKYLSALNILEKSKTSQKPKTNEIRTRSKTEEKREQLRITDNITKVIDDVAVNYSATHDTGDVDPTSKKKEETVNSKSDNCEIFVKSFAKIAPDNGENKSKTPTSGFPVLTYSLKHRARKSFPQPNYNKAVTKPVAQNSPTKELQTKSTPPVLIQCKADAQKITVKTGTVTQAPITTTITTATSQQTARPIPPLAPTNGYLILQQPQQENLLLIPPNTNLNYTNPLTNQMVSMTPCLVSATNTATLRQFSQPPTIWTSPASIQFKPSLNISTSQNYTTQSEKVPDNTITIATTTMANISNASQSSSDVTTQPQNDTLSSATISKKTTNVAEPQKESDIPATEGTAIIEPQVESETITNNTSLNNVTESISRAIAEIVKRPLPKLKPRPPGMLSQQFIEGLPSSVGPVTAKVNAVAHRMCDYFRGMLIETLEDFGKANNPEGTIASLKLEIETLKHRHSIELSEIEKNISTVLKDVKRSIEEEKEKIIEQTRIACEAETLKRIDDAKSKQWCANCLKEAQFYCCWNTSYCDYPCQQKHWPVHMNKCTQHMNQAAQSTTVRPSTQQLILRPANPPQKGNIGRVITKPIQKLYVNRNLARSKTMRVQASGNVLRMMETRPGNFQLMTNSLIKTTTTNVKPGNIVAVTTSTPSPSSSVKKSSTTKTTVKILSHSSTTILDDDSD